MAGNHTPSEDKTSTEHLSADKCTVSAPRHGSTPAFTVPRIPNTLTITISDRMQNREQQKLTKTKLVILHVCSFLREKQVKSLVQTPCLFWNTNAKVPRYE